jgi:branched-chain amino acid transport system substrate-binding protein
VNPARARLAAAIAVLAAMLALAACGSESTNGRQRLDLKIADLVPRTGIFQPFAAAGQQAADLAVDEIRKAAAKAGAQHKIAITHADYRSLPKTAKDEAEKLTKAGSTCMVGPWAVPHIERVANQVTVRSQVPLISPSASGSALTKAEDLGYVFRVVPPDPLQAHALVELVDDKLRGGARGKKVNVGATKSTYGADLMKEFEDAWTGKGGRIGEQVTYQATQATLAPEVEKLASGDPDAWIFFDFQDTYARVAVDLTAQKSAKFVPRKAFGTDSLANPRLVSTPSVSNGLRGVAISAPRQGQAAEEFDRRFTARGPVKRQNFDAQAFDSVVLCYLAAVAAGSTKGEKIADEIRGVSAPPGRKFTWLQLDQAVKALEAGQDIDYDGASGPIDMNAAGDPTAGVYDVYEFKDSKLELREQIAIPERAGGI